jgi:ArsR family transcriptional regulator, lead/cadmium/zinc/bismuth-responsive transcriptional repressor
MDDTTCSRVFADRQQIKNCKDKLQVRQEPLLRLSNILALAGNEVRLKIVYLLEEEKELCPCDLADILGMSIPAVSQHLRKLKDGNLVETRKVGQMIYYSLTPKNLQVLKPLFAHIYLQIKSQETV